MLPDQQENNANLQISTLVFNSKNEKIKHYSLKIIIESILWLKNLQNYNIVLRFYNPANQTIFIVPKDIRVTLNDLVYLENIQCRMNVECSPSKVRNFISNWFPLIIIFDKNDKILSKCSLDLGRFKLIQKKERYFETKTLFELENNTKKLAEINLVLTIYDHDVLIYNEHKLSNIGLPLFLQITEQLENWRETQKHIYQKQEEEKLKKITEDMTRDKNKLKEQLTKVIKETENQLKSIKEERDLLKDVIETELGKRDIKLIYNSKENKIDAKHVEKLKENPREIKELLQLRRIILKQTEEISELKNKYKYAEKYDEVFKKLNSLRSQLQVKNTEIQLLKQQWAMAVRELNTYKKKYKKKEESPRPKSPTIPEMVEKLLKHDSVEQKQDLDQLTSIRKELNELKKKNRTEKITNQSELETLLQTQSYSFNDRLIQMLYRNKNKN